MESNGIAVHQRAEISVDSLTKAERRTLFQKLQRLQEVPRERWTRKGVRKLKPDEELYLLKFVGDLLVVFSVTKEQQIVVEHLFRQEAVDFFAAMGKEAGWPTPKHSSGSRGA